MLREILMMLKEQGGSLTLEAMEQSLGVSRPLLLQMLETLVAQGRLQREVWQRGCSAENVDVPGESTLCKGCPLRSLCVSSGSTTSWGTLYRLPNRTSSERKGSGELL